MATTAEVRRCTRFRDAPLMTGLVSDQAPGKPGGNASAEGARQGLGHQCPKTAGLLKATMPCLERF